MGRLRYWLFCLARSFIKRVCVPLARPVVWYIVFHELNRDPLHLQYIKCRIDLLDKYDELFPGAKKCRSREEVYDAAIQALRTSGLKGLWMEFGVWRGKSINYLAAHTDAAVYGFDSFEGLPVDWKQGVDEEAVQAKYFEVKSLPRVRGNVQLVKGWFDKTLPEFLAAHAESAALIHIDSDVYVSARTVFDQLGDRIGKGTVIVFDEYFNYPSWEDNEYKAFHEFARAKGLKFRFLAYNPYGEQAALEIL